MRIQIRTNKPIKDKDILALYMISAALEPCSTRMKIATLQFFADKLGMRIVNKP